MSLLKNIGNAVLFRCLFLTVALAIAAIAQAQTTTCAQGPSSPQFEWKQNISARWGGKTQQVLVLNSAPTLVPAVALAGRKAIEIQNLGPNVIYCTVDGQAPAIDGSLGRMIGATNGTWALDVGAGVVIKCIAKTADQVSTAATQVTELR